MSEKAALIDKLPPATRGTTPPVSPEATLPVSPETTGTVVDAVPASEVTISGLQSITYYSFILNLVLLGIAGIFFLTKAMREKEVVNFRAMVYFGGFLLVMSLTYFYMKGAYAAFLWDTRGPLTLAFRGFAWVLFGPLLLWQVSNLVTLRASEKNYFYIMLGIAGLMFGLIGLAHVGDPGLIRKAVLSGLALSTSCALVLMLFRLYQRLPDLIPEAILQGFQWVLLTIILGWTFYPLLNLVSIFVPSHNAYLLLYNLVDLATFAGIASGFYLSASKRKELFLVKPSFATAPGGSASPQKAEETAEEPVEESAPTPRKPAGPKPKGPVAPKPRFDTGEEVSPSQDVMRN